MEDRTPRSSGETAGEKRGKGGKRGDEGGNKKSQTRKQKVVLGCFPRQRLSYVKENVVMNEKSRQHSKITLH